MSRKSHITEAIEILTLLGLPSAQQNEQSAFCLLALLNLSKDGSWRDVGNPLMGITPIMDWVRAHYGKSWKPNTRETIRKKSIHQFVDAGVAVYNPDDPSRAVNSPNAVYQIEPTVLLLHSHPIAYCFDGGL